MKKLSFALSILFSGSLFLVLAQSSVTAGQATANKQASTSTAKSVNPGKAVTNTKPATETKQPRKIHISGKPPRVAK